MSEEHEPDASHHDAGHQDAGHQDATHQDASHHDTEWYWDLNRKLAVPASERGPGDHTLGPYPSKAEAEVGWRPTKVFEQALEETVRWYLDNEAWWRPIREGRYSGERLGLAQKSA